MIQTINVIMNYDLADKFKRYCKNEQFYNVLWAELLNAKPEEIINGRISLFIKKGQWQRTQVIDEKGKKIWILTWQNFKDNIKYIKDYSNTRDNIKQDGMITQ